MRLPISFSDKRGELETKILKFSNRIFKNPKTGFTFAILNNILFLYSCYYKRPLFAIFIFFNLITLVSHIIMFQFIGKK
jgi:hypothetical protein